MLQYIKALQTLLQPGVQLQKNEVIKRYRSLAGYSEQVLRQIAMTDFFMIAKNEKGEISFS